MNDLCVSMLASSEHQTSRLLEQCSAILMMQGANPCMVLLPAACACCQHTCGTANYQLLCTGLYARSSAHMYASSLCMFAMHGCMCAGM